jgi:hypothetical protein
MSQLPLQNQPQLLVGPIDDSAAAPTIRWGGSAVSSSGTGLYGDYDSVSIAIAGSDVAVIDSSGITANLIGNASSSNGAISLASANIETISAAGAVSISKAVTKIAIGTGGYAITLAAPSVSGQIKIIEVVSRTSGSVTMALTNVVGARAANGDIVSTSVTFDDTSDSIVLISAAGKWLCLNSSAICS